MNPNELFTLREVAALLGMPLRRVRGWADMGRLDYINDVDGKLRLVPASEIQRLQDRGFFVDWTAIEPADMADSATSAKPVPDGLIGLP